MTGTMIWIIVAAVLMTALLAWLIAALVAARKEKVDTVVLMEALRAQMTAES